jgi:hypothetical protein
MTTTEELQAWLAAAQPSQRDKLAILRTEHLEMIRALRDDEFAVVVRAIKKRLGSPKLADEVAALVLELGRRETKPVERAPVAEPEAVRWIGTSDDDQLTALEAAIAADPEAQGPYSVLADYLTSLGDVRGELMTIGAALTKNPTHKAMRVAWDELLARHARTLWGPLAHKRGLVEQVEWYMGWIRACEVRGDPQRAIAVEDLFAALLDDPGPARFVQRLVLKHTWGDTCEPIARALASRPRSTLRTLVLGNTSRLIGDISAMWPVLEHVRDVTLTDHRGATLGNVIAPRLERLAIEHGPREDGLMTIDWLASVFDATGVPKLRVLSLTNCEYADAVCEALVRSPLASQLEELDLREGTLTDAGVAALYAHREQLAAVKRWRFELNYLTPAATDQLAQLAGDVEVGEQRAWEEDRHAFAYDPAYE